MRINRRTMLGAAAGAVVMPAAVAATPMVEIHPNDVMSLDQLEWHAEEGVLVHRYIRDGKPCFVRITVANGNYQRALGGLRSWHERNGTLALWTSPTAWGAAHA